MTNTEILSGKIEAFKDVQKAHKEVLPKIQEILKTFIGKQILNVDGSQDKNFSLSINEVLEQVESKYKLNQCSFYIPGCPLQFLVFSKMKNVRAVSYVAELYLSKAYLINDEGEEEDNYSFITLSTKIKLHIDSNGVLKKIIIPEIKTPHIPTVSDIVEKKREYQKIKKQYIQTTNKIFKDIPNEFHTDIIEANE